MTTDETIAAFEKYVIGNYTRYPVVIVRGEGSRIWDLDDKEYLDLFPGWGTVSLGHCHPALVEAITRQVKRLIHVPNNYHMLPQVELARVLHEKGFGGKAFFCNSGAEAVETAIKLARRHTAPERTKIVTMHNSFHGRTLAAITATAQPKYHAGFEPLPGGFEYVPFGEIKALEAVVDETTAAVMFEPIQGEGGVNIPPEGFLVAVRRLCDERGALLVLDEVQTGCGRTGKYFGHQLCGVTPDIMTLAKALGGGFPIGAIVATDEVAASLVPGTHASTYGGNPLACAAGMAVFTTIEKEGLLERAKTLGQRIREGLAAIAEETGGVKEIRGRGLMNGMELDRPGAPIVDGCRNRGLLINCTHETVLRIMPALTVTEEEIDEGLEILAAVMKETGGN